MAKENPAEKGRNVKADGAQVSAVATGQSVVDPAAMTYEQDSNGNIVAGPGVGVAPGTTLATPESQMTEQTEQAAPAVIQPAYNPEDYLVDWKTVTPQQAYNLNKHSINDLIEDQRKFANATGSSFNWIPWMGLAKDQDISKTKEQNELEAKRAARREKMDQVGNFLLHLGNFVGTAGFGGLDIKPENPIQYTERQRQLKEKATALRNAYNKDFFANMAKQQAEDRERELNNANIALRNQQILASQQDAARKDKEAEANITLKGKQGAYNDERATTEKELRPYRKKSEEARAAASRASATASYARANATNRSAYGTNYNNQRFDILAENLESNPEEAAKFMADHNIHGRDKKDWTTNQIDQFNSEMALKRKKTKANTRQSSKPSTRQKVVY